MNISFIGYGNIAKALIKGLVQQSSYSISAAAPSLPTGINDGIHTYSNNKDAIKEAQIIILAVKPMQMDTVMKDIAPAIPAGCLLISVATGLNTDWFAARCPTPTAILRAMPNTPAAVGMSATPLFANANMTAEQKLHAERIFASIGITAWVDDESDIDSFTAVSGSGPAYVFLFIESMMQAAKQFGLPDSVARLFCLQTVSGACALAQHSDLELTQLRKNVTSPNGTTAAALKVLEPELPGLVLQAIEAARARAVEMGKSY